MTDMDYKEKQKEFRRINKERGSYIFISKERGDIKGRTYIKRIEELKRLEKEQLDKEEKNNEQQ